MFCLGAVQGVELQAHLVSGVQRLDGEVPLGKVAVADSVHQVVGGVAVAHLELPGILSLIVRHELGACSSVVICNGCGTTFWRGSHPTLCPIRERKHSACK